MTWKRVDSFSGNSSSPELLESRPCPVCGALDARGLLALPGFQFFSDSERLPKRADVHTVLCRSCCAAYMNPSYSTYGFSVLFDEAEQSYGAAAEHYTAQVDWLTDRGLLAAGRSVLDVGCYDGSFLALLPDDVQLFGVDIDSSAIERARLRLGDRAAALVCSDFERFALPAAPDVVVMFHVLEHVQRPVEVLRRLHDVGHPDTRLVVEVPIVELGETNDVVGFFSVQHLTHFSRSTVGAVLAAAGWTIATAQEMTGYNGLRIEARRSDATATPSADPGDVDRVQAVLASWDEAAASASRRLEAVESEPRLVLYGAGQHTEYLYHRTPLFDRMEEREYVIVDGDGQKQGKTWRGIHIVPPTRLPELAAGGAPVVVSSYGSQESIAAAVAAMGIPAESTIRLYDSLSVY